MCTIKVKKMLLLSALLIFPKLSFAKECLFLSELKNETRKSSEVYRFELCEKRVLKTIFDGDEKKITLSEIALSELKKILSRITEDGSSSPSNGCKVSIKIKTAPDSEYVGACLQSEDYVYEQYRELFLSYYRRSQK